MIRTQVTRRLPNPQIEWVMRIDSIPNDSLDSLADLTPLDRAALVKAGIDDVPKLTAYLQAGKLLTDLPGFGDKRAEKVQAAWESSAANRGGILDRGLVSEEVEAAMLTFADVRRSRGRSGTVGDYGVANEWLKHEGRIYARIRWHVAGVYPVPIVLAARSRDPRFHKLQNSALPIQECYEE